MTPKKSAILIFCVFIKSAFFTQEGRVIVPHPSPAVKFTENNGQWNERVLCRAAIPGGAMFLEKGGITFNFYDWVKMGKLHTGGIAKGECENFSIHGHAYRMEFQNALPSPVLGKMQPTADYENHYRGKDPARWRSNVRNYGQIWLRGIYPGIDYEMLAATDGAKYNFHVKAGFDVSVIRLKFSEVSEMRIENGELQIRTTVNSVTEQKPYAYQLINGEAKEVPCRFRLQDRVVWFEFPEGYDKSHDLVIDPVLVFSAQIGTSADNFGMTATFDHLGNLYSGGVVYFPGYPYVLGSYDNNFTGPVEYGSTDVFITKYNASGNSLIYSTYLGGTSTEVVSSLIVDQDNRLCLYGATGSSDFPVTTGAAFTTFAGGSDIGFVSNGVVFHPGTDIYITKFNASGTALMASTFFGGSGNDGINYLAATSPITYPLSPAPGSGATQSCGYDSLLTNYGDQFRGEIQIDSTGNIYICSSTRSYDLPLMNAFDNSLGGKQDAVVAMFDNSLSTLLFSSYLGGSGMESGNAIFVTPQNEIYATGGTTSSDMTGTSGAHGPSYKGGETDGFLTRISSTGAHLRTTYIGTVLYDNSFFVQCDKYGEVYVYGQSLGNMPVQPKANLPLFSVAGTHQFVSCYSGDLSTLLMSTVFGNKTNGLDISPSAFAIDECNGNIYLSGWGGGLITNTSPLANMPILNPTKATTTGYDFYLMALKPNATALLYGSYYGGNQSQEHVDGGTSRFDRKGIIYQSVCAGCGNNDDFPISPNAWPCPGSQTCPDPNKSPNCNNGVFKINFDLQRATASITTNTTMGCAPLTVTFTNAKPGTSYIWDLGNGNTTSVVSSPVVTYSVPGSHTVILFVRDTTMCIREDTTITVIQSHPGASPKLNIDLFPCTTSIVASATLEPGTTGVSWDLGNGHTSTVTSFPYTYPVGGTYTITLSGISTYSCPGSKTHTIGVLDFKPTAAPGGTLCRGSALSLLAEGGTIYNWSPSGSLDSPVISNPNASPISSTIYTVNVVNNSFGLNCSEDFTVSVEVMPQPTTAFVYTVHPCGGQVNFADQSVADVVGWLWNFGNAGSSTSPNPSFYFEEGGLHTVTLTSTNKHGCSDQDLDSLFVSDASPSVSGGVNICLGEHTELVAGGGMSYLWTPEESLDQPYLPKTIATPTITTVYSVVITTGETNSVTGAPCEFTLTTEVSVSELSHSLAISAGADPTVVVKGNGTTLTYLGDPGADITWLPAKSTTPEKGYVVSAKPEKPTTYTVIARRDACVEQIPVFVDVYSNLCVNSEIFIPNTFTPNGDGSNDIFRVRGLSVDEAYLAIYNRWGERVFESHDLQAGWDGRYRDKDVDVGVFGWYLKVKCFNGEETFLKGNVTLIR